MLNSYDPRSGDDPRDRGDARDLTRAGTDPRERGQIDPRDVFSDHVDLPRGLDREHVHHRDHDYTLRGSETRTLATVGAFRVVAASDLRDKFDESLDPRQGELWHLRESGLVHTVQLDRDTTVVTLTKEGRDLLESRRNDADAADRQPFHDGIHKPRELTHDAQVYRAYLEEADHLREEGANIHRVLLDDELKREYQQFLQERNRDHEDSDGRPDRDVEEVRGWAREHDLPCDEEGHVQFPDARIEYDVDGRHHTRDVEVVTPHYRGAHAAAKSSSGFACHRGGSARLVASTGSRGGSGRSGAGLAEELLR
jgi:hypothetical protein